MSSLPSTQGLSPTLTCGSQASALPALDLGPTAESAPKKTPPAPLVHIFREAIARESNHKVSNPISAATFNPFGVITSSSFAKTTSYSFAARVSEAPAVASSSRALDTPSKLPTFFSDSTASVHEKFQPFGAPPLTHPKMPPSATLEYKRSRDGRLLNRAIKETTEFLDLLTTKSPMAKPSTSLPFSSALPSTLALNHLAMRASELSAELSADLSLDTRLFPKAPRLRPTASNTLEARHQITAFSLTQEATSDIPELALPPSSSPDEAELAAASTAIEEPAEARNSLAEALSLRSSSLDEDFPAAPPSSKRIKRARSISFSGEEEFNALLACPHAYPASILHTLNTAATASPKATGSHEKDKM